MRSPASALAFRRSRRRPQSRNSFQEVAESWLTRHVVKNELRSKREITRLLSSHVYPAWKDRDFLSIRRSDVATLLDRVEDNHSARQADYVLSVVRSVMNWYAARHDDYVPPIVRGMRRQSPTAQARARTLHDDEIRLIWHAVEGAAKFRRNHQDLPVDCAAAHEGRDDTLVRHIRRRRVERAVRAARKREPAACSSYPMRRFRSFALSRRSATIRSFLLAAPMAHFREPAMRRHGLTPHCLRSHRGFFMTFAGRLGP